jgi:hypothetical protein
MMYSDFTLVVQGPTNDSTKIDFLDSIDYYKTLFSKIILSTYDEHICDNKNLLKICEEKNIEIVTQSLENGINNLSFKDFDENHDMDNDCGIKFQTVSTLIALKNVHTPYVLKHRVDERYSNLHLILDKFLLDTEKLVTGGTFFGQKVYFEYCAADHLMVSRTGKMINTFEKTLEMINSGILDSGPEIMYTKNFIRISGENPTSENHDILMKKYIDFLPDKYMEPFVIRANHWNQIWTTAESLGHRRNAYETIDDMINSEIVVLNQFYNYS